MNQQQQTIDLEQLFNACHKENQENVELINKNNLILTLIQELGNCREQLKSYKALQEALDGSDTEEGTNTQA